MRGTSRSGWAAVAIAAEQAGLTRDEGLRRVAEVEFVHDSYVEWRPLELPTGHWRVRFRVGGLPAFGDASLPAAYNVAEQEVESIDVDAALAEHPEVPKITRASVYRI